MCSCSCETFCFAACCRLARGHCRLARGHAGAQEQSPVARGRDSINGHFLAGGPWVPGNIPSLFDRGALGPRIPPFSDRGLLGSRIPSLFGRGSLRLRFLPFLFSSLPRMIMNQALALLHKRLYPLKVNILPAQSDDTWRGDAGKT